MTVLIALVGGLVGWDFTVHVVAIKVVKLHPDEHTL